MAVSSDEFIGGMRRLGGAVNIVTTAEGGRWAGLTATAVTSLSAEPPQLLTCINRQGVTYEAVSKSRNLCVNVLGVEHRQLAMRFAGMDGSEETERFTEGEWQEGVTGAPLLSSALVNFDCVVESILDSGSHGIVIGRVESVRLRAADTSSPLCYVDGNWATLATID